MATDEEGGFPSTTAGVEFGWEKPVSSRKRKEESKRKTKPGSFGANTCIMSRINRANTPPHKPPRRRHERSIFVCTTQY